MVLGELLLMLRGIPAANAKAHRGVWHKLAVGAYEARGKKPGIIGYGYYIGTQLGILAECLGMKVFFYDIKNKLSLGNAQQVHHLSDLLNMSDVLTERRADVACAGDPVYQEHDGGRKTGIDEAGCHPDQRLARHCSGYPRVVQCVG